MNHIEEAIELIQALGLPKAQQNERSALCLLALLDLSPKKGWPEAQNPLMGITPIMKWINENYGKEYAPNTRETFRRQTMYQFCSAGLVLYNPDDLSRPVNSPKAVYRVEEEALALLRIFQSKLWSQKLSAYLADRDTLVARYAKERNQTLIPFALPNVPKGETIQLSPGEHSSLIRTIILEFGPRFAPGSTLVYIGDTATKWGYFDPSILENLGIQINSHGKMPDLILYDKVKEWLFLVEAVTSHGPVNGKRHEELSQLFTNRIADLVFVTAFPNRSLMARYIAELAWETEVWVADAPSHLIHFNGTRFLGHIKRKGHQSIGTNHERPLRIFTKQI